MKSILNSRKSSRTPSSHSRTFLKLRRGVKVVSNERYVQLRAINFEISSIFIFVCKNFGFRNEIFQKSIKNSRKVVEQVLPVPGHF